jgi:hypothetical protein
MYDLELFFFVEVEQVDLAQGVEIVAGAWENSIYRILDLDAGHEPALSPAPPALRRAPGGSVVAPPFAVGALPEGRVPDRNGSQAASPLAVLPPALLVGDLLLCEGLRLYAEGGQLGAGDEVVYRLGDGLDARR